MRPCAMDGKCVSKGDIVDNWSVWVVWDKNCGLVLKADIIEAACEYVHEYAEGDVINKSYSGVQLFDPDANGVCTARVSIAVI